MFRNELFAKLKMHPLFLALVAGMCFAGSIARADHNMDSQRRAVEDRGGKVYWGKHFDHVEYLKLTAALASGTGGTYAVDLAKAIAKDFGKEIGLDVLNKLLNGESIDLGNVEIQGGFATYSHWERTVHEFFDGWPPRWQRIENKIPLPNTFQLYLRVKQK